MELQPPPIHTDLDLMKDSTHTMRVVKTTTLLVMSTKIPALLTMTRTQLSVETTTLRTSKLLQCVVAAWAIQSHGDMALVMATDLVAMAMEVDKVTENTLVESSGMVAPTMTPLVMSMAILALTTMTPTKRNVETTTLKTS